jgi:exopolyphosphatase/pppGpp-phosphohydrolase
MTLKIETSKKINKFAIIDLGSSTIKLTVSEIDEYNQITVLLKKSITTNLAEDYFDTNTINDDAKERTIQGLKDLKDEAVEYGVVDFKLIATKVVRDAKNSVDVIKEIRQETNLELEVLSKEDETRYVVKAVLESFDNSDIDMLIINAGGGSSQVSFNIDNKMHEYSLPIGISDLNEKFIQEYPIKDSKYKEMKEFIKETLKKEIKDIPQIDTMVYTGGELDYMLMTGFPLEEFDGSISHPKKISLRSFKEYAAKMRKMKLEEIQAFMPNNPNWMNGAIASNTLLETFAELFKVKTIIPSNKNVNDGILLTMK